MRLYKTKFDINRPSMQKLTIPADSDIAIGFEVYKDDAKLNLELEDVTLTDGADTLSCTTTYAGMPCMKYSTVENADDKQLSVIVDKEAVFVDTGYTGYWHPYATVFARVQLSAFVGQTIDKTVVLAGRDKVLGTFNYHTFFSIWNTPLNAYQCHWQNGVLYNATMSNVIDSYTIKDGDMIKTSIPRQTENVGHSYDVFFGWGVTAKGTFPLQIDVNENLPVEIDDTKINNVETTLSALHEAIGELSSVEPTQTIPIGLYNAETADEATVADLFTEEGEFTYGSFRFYATKVSDNSYNLKCTYGQGVSNKIENITKGTSTAALSTDILIEYGDKAKIRDDEDWDYICIAKDVEIAS